MQFVKSAVLGLSFASMSCSAYAAPENYTLDGGHTQIIWKVERFGFNYSVGTFTDISGSLILDEDNPENSSVTASIAVASVHSDNAEREDNVKSEFFLDAEKYPTITFTSTDVKLLDTEDDIQTAHVTGDLSLHGVTAPVTMTVTLNKIGTEPPTRKKAMGFSASGKFDRSVYGINTAMNFLGRDVIYEIEALAIKKD